MNRRDCLRFPNRIASGGVCRTVHRAFESDFLHPGIARVTVISTGARARKKPPSFRSAVICPRAHAPGENVNDDEAFVYLSGIILSLSRRLRPSRCFEGSWIVGRATWKRARTLSTRAGKVAVLTFRHSTEMRVGSPLPDADLEQIYH